MGGVGAIDEAVVAAWRRALEEHPALERQAFAVDGEPRPFGSRRRALADLVELTRAQLAAWPTDPVPFADLCAAVEMFTLQAESIVADLEVAEAR